MPPIPGTSNPHHLVENIAAGALELSVEAFAALDHQGRNALEPRASSTRRAMTSMPARRRALARYSSG